MSFSTWSCLDEEAVLSSATLISITAGVEELRSCNRLYDQEAAGPRSLVKFRPAKWLILGLYRGPTCTAISMRLSRLPLQLNLGPEQDSTLRFAPKGPSGLECIASWGSIGCGTDFYFQLSFLLTDTRVEVRKVKGTSRAKHCHILQCKQFAELYSSLRPVQRQSSAVIAANW